MENENATPGNVTKLPNSEKAVPNPQMLARLYVREGKSFKSSALESGYALTVAERGAKACMSASNVLREAIQSESDKLFTLDKLKPLAVRRLHDEIANPKSSGGLKAIEIAGRFKETDWFVRNSEMQIGVFANFAESGPAETVIDVYREDANEGAESS